MEINCVDSREFEKVTQESVHVFQLAAFNDLNKDKCDSVHYLIFRDTKNRLGIVLGKTNNVFFSPFSAPFGGFFPIVGETKLSYFENALDLLIEWVKSNGGNNLSITIPPEVYAQSFISKQLNSLWCKGFEIKDIDVNYAYYLKNFDKNYIGNLPRNARKNLNIALKSNLSFSFCGSEEDQKLAYGVIKQNREARGFPLRMTWEQVFNTVQIIKADFFIARNSEGEEIAAAMVFHVSPKIVQVIYWGDIPEYSNLKTMNFLSFKVFEYYRNKGLDVVDIGPSSENSIANHGLAEFKESIGCIVGTKYKLELKLN